MPKLSYADVLRSRTQALSSPPTPEEPSMLPDDSASNSPLSEGQETVADDKIHLTPDGPSIATTPPTDVDLPTAGSTSDDQNGLTEIEKRRKQLMLDAFSRANARMWELQFGWDVLLMSEGMRWKLHRRILCEESEWFAERLPPENADGSYVQIHCEGHQRDQLAHVLKFMYVKKYDGSRIPADDPLDGRSVQKNVFMYICGASVHCHSMMNYAIEGINDAVELVGRTLPVQYGWGNLARFHEYLLRGLVLAFDQGNRPVMAPLRLHMARLVDVSMMYLVLDHEFRNRFYRYWTPWVFLNCVQDSIFFAQVGMLNSAPEGRAPVFDEALETTEEFSDGPGAAQELGDDPQDA